MLPSAVAKLEEQLSDKDHPRTLNLLHASVRHCLWRVQQNVARPQSSRSGPRGVKGNLFAYFSLKA